MDRKELKDIINKLAMITQLGLSLIVPTLLCVWFSWYLTAHKGVGLWVYIPGFVLGIGSSAMTAYKFYVSIMKKEKKEKKKRVSFNRHM